MEELKYLKAWPGFVTGSMAGRDDGYPETKIQVFESVDRLAKHPTHPGEVIYTLEALSPMTALAVIEKARQEEKNRDAAKRRNDTKNKIKELQQELDEGA